MLLHLNLTYSIASTPFRAVSVVYLNLEDIIISNDLKLKGSS